MTRAQQELQLSLTQYRTFRGQARPSIPSQFLMELPREEMQYDEPASFSFEDQADQLAGDSEFDEFNESGYDAIDEPARARKGQPVWSDDDFVQDAPEPFPDTAESTLVTAAELAEKRPGGARKYSPHVFQRGMLVTHPEYGTGKILSVSGTGVKRRVRVCFEQENDARSFLVAHSPLEPLLAGQ
jgi:DNA helicase-2/ATP-dependent DNA helicase PcrA